MIVRRRVGVVLMLALVAALLGLVSSSPAAATEIGPDTFGYEASDSNGAGGPVFTPVDISASGTDLALSGDDMQTGPVALTTPFSFYGTTYNSLRVGTNGIIGFGATNVAGDLSNDCPLPAAPSTGDGARIYPLHDDMVLGSAQIQRFATSPVPNYYTPGTYEPAGGATVIQYTDVAHWPGGGATWDMWVILHDDGDITTQVGPGNPENGSGSTTGIQDAAYTDGLTTVCDSANSVPDNYVAHFENPNSPLTTSPIMVTTGDDVIDFADDVMSLREAVHIANKTPGPDTIELASGSTHTLSVCGPDPAQEDVNLDGDLDLFTTDATTINGNGATLTTTCQERLISSVGPMTINDATMHGGTTAGEGGAILAIGGLEVHGSTLHDNTNTGIAGGAIRANGPLKIADSSIRDNTSNNAGGGVAASGPSVEILRSSFTGNSVTGPPASFGGGGLATTAVTSVTVTNSTFSGNTGFGGAAMTSQTNGVSLTHVTVVANTTTDAARADVETANALTAVGSVIASSAGAGANCAVNGATTSNGYNVSGDGTCGFADTTDQNGTGGSPLDPMVEPLEFASPGAHTPLPGSPLLDTIPTDMCGDPVDIRGTSRPQGPGCEIGALESVVTNELDMAGRFVPLPPARLFDTRPGTGPAAPVGQAKGIVAANSSIDVQITGIAGVPADAIAVVMNVTATEAVADGFITAWPTGETRPNASNLNMTLPGQTRPNLVTVPIGANGRVSLYTQRGTHLLADVAGYYLDQDAPIAEGRVVPVTPFRVFDTRPTAPPGPKGKVPANGSIDVQITGVGGLPATGIAAVIMNVTATEATADGFITAWPTGQVRPNSSILNLDGPGATAPNLVIVPVGAGGKVSLYTQRGAHLLADVTAYITDDTAAPATTGLFVPLNPTRVFDTRPSVGGAGPKGFVGPGATINAKTGGAAGIPSTAIAAVLNVTATEAAAAGFVTTWPNGTPKPNASTLNLVAGDTRPNAAILPIGAGGNISYFTQSGAHLLADTAGYYLG